jgi:hypothetical protein
VAGKGPRSAPDRLCLQEILFVPHTRICWEDLPAGVGVFGSGGTMIVWPSAVFEDKVDEVGVGIQVEGR